MGHVGIDFLHQFADTAKRAASYCLLGDQSEPALHLVEPTGVGGSVVDVVTRPAREPSLNLRMFMGAVVIRDQMDIESGRDATVEVIEKSEKFLVAMAWFAHRNDFAIEHVERRKQSSSAVPKAMAG